MGTSVGGSDPPADLWRQLKRELCKLFDEHSIVPILVIEQAQNLCDDFFHDLAGFLNFAFDRQDLLTICLVGLSSLRVRLDMAVHSALLALGCPAQPGEVEETAPGQIVVDVSGAGDLVSVGCGATTIELVAQDLGNAIERCRALASVPIRQGTVRVNAHTSFSKVFAATQLLHTNLRDTGSVVIDEEGASSLPFRPRDVCYAATPVEACTHLSLEVLQTQMALKSWPGHTGLCASPRERAASYGQRRAASPPGEKQALACHVETTGNTARQLGALGTRAKSATQGVTRCSIGTASVHDDVPWHRAAAAVASLKSWTGEVPALSASPTEERGLLGCKDDL